MDSPNLRCLSKDKLVSLPPQEARCPKAWPFIYRVYEGVCGRAISLGELWIFKVGLVDQSSYIQGFIRFSDLIQSTSRTRVQIVDIGQIWQKIY